MLNIERYIIHSGWLNDKQRKRDIVARFMRFYDVPSLPFQYGKTKYVLQLSNNQLTFQDVTDNKIIYIPDPHKINELIDHLLKETKLLGPKVLMS